MNQPTGYASKEYAMAFAEWGEPIYLPRCGGWLIRRQIPDTPYFDAMGCYPLFCCLDWGGLGEDLQEIAKQGELVSVCLVADPFLTVSPQQLADWFGDLMRPFKQHYLIDLSLPYNKIADKKTRYYVRLSAKQLTCQVCQNPQQYLEQWVELYQHLIERHRLNGIHCFSQQSFVWQFQAPEFILFGAFAEQQPVAMLCCYTMADRAYAHLFGAEKIAYDYFAIYLLFFQMIEFYKTRNIRWLNIGGVAGTGEHQREGLDVFKRKWASATRPTYLCGRIFRPDVYWQLVEQKKMQENRYFPQYRWNDFKSAATEGSPLSQQQIG